MTARNILLIQGHPDTIAPHLCHALADAYAEGARQAGHDERRCMRPQAADEWMGKLRPLGREAG